MMAICHTAVPERADGKITFQAASPGRSDLCDQSNLEPQYSKLVLIHVLMDLNLLSLLLSRLYKRNENEK